MATRKISEKTIVTALVNYKCVGFFGKCFRPLTRAERTRAVDEMMARGWLKDNPMRITAAGDEVILRNLALCQY